MIHRRKLPNFPAIKVMKEKNQKTEVGKKSFQMSSNIITDARTVKSLETNEPHLKENSCREPFNESDSYSVAEEIIDVSNIDDYFDIDTARNFIPIRTEG